MENKRRDNKGRVLKKGESQLNNGLYRFRYTDKNGIRHTEYSWRLISSDRLPIGKKDGLPLRDIEINIQKASLDNVIYDNSLTLNILFDKYINIKVALSENTIENYTYLYNKEIRDTVLGKSLIKDIKKSNIKEFYNFLYKEKQYSISTIQLFQNFLFPAFKMAIEDGLIKSNPSEGAMEIFKGMEISEKSALSKEEQKALQIFLKDDLMYKKYYPFVIFCLATGARMSEALGITWDDIDFEKGIVSINHQTKYKRINGKVVWRAGKLKWAKNKKQNVRLIPVHKDVLDVLQAHKDETYLFSCESEFKVDTIEEQKNFDLKPYYKNFVFINSEGNLITPNTINRALRGIVNRYNKRKEDSDIPLPLFSAHTLRYTFATRNAENKMDIKVLQTLMGHKNIATTMDIYNKVSEQRKIDEIQSTVSPIAL